MRSAPSVSIRRALPVSRHRVRRPSFSASSQPAAAVRISACRVAFSSMPRRPKAASTADVQAVPSVVSTNSPSRVNSSPRALGAPAACRRDRAGAAGSGGLSAGMTAFPVAAPAAAGRRGIRCYFQAKTGCSKCATLIMFPCRPAWQNW